MHIIIHIKDSLVPIDSKTHKFVIRVNKKAEILSIID